MPKRPTLADVARRAGVSSAAASMVLNRRPGSRISEEVSRRVLEVAADLGYSPDPAARSLRTGRTKTVGFISDGVTVTRYASAMIRGVTDAAEAEGYTVMMAEVDDRPERWKRALRDMTQRRVDALVFGLMGAREVALPPLPGAVPAVIVNGTSPGIPHVLPDEENAGRRAVERLAAAGHRRIAFIGRSPRLLDVSVSATVGARYRGIDAAMAEQGLEYAGEIEGSEWEPELGYQGTLSLLDRSLDGSQPFTALLAANDRVAFGAYQALAARGLAVPEDVSVMSFDDEALAAYLRPGLTTMRLPYREMGRAGVEMALAGEAAERLIDMPLIERQSVGAPGRSA